MVKYESKNRRYFSCFSASTFLSRDDVLLPEPVSMNSGSRTYPEPVLFLSVKQAQRAFMAESQRTVEAPEEEEEEETEKGRRKETSFEVSVEEEEEEEKIHKDSSHDCCAEFLNCDSEDFEAVTTRGSETLVSSLLDHPCCPSPSQLLNDGAVVGSPPVGSWSGLSVGGLDVKARVPTMQGSVEGCKAISSTSDSSPLHQRLPLVPQDDNVDEAEVSEQKSLDQNAESADIEMKTPSTDGYNWRKYGQKHVKSTDSSRSYYRCTSMNCCAKKKVERCDHRIVEIIYKGRHNHDPPRKVRCMKARRSISSSRPEGGGRASTDHPFQEQKDSDPSPSRGGSTQAILEQQPKRLSNCDQNVRVKAEEKQGDEPNPKRRIQGSNVSYTVPLLKTVKEPKIVVQAGCDVGISGDGYRWRKYGQKMVKGNLNPRSYYKCTSAGCPVRKHLERSMDDTTSITITYEGKHDHDMPVPKKRHGPPSTALLIAASAAMSTAQIKTSEALTNLKASSPHWSTEEGKETHSSEKTSELGGDKVLESARTLLSIGIELKPY